MVNQREERQALNILSNFNKKNDVIINTNGKASQLS